MSTPRVPWIAGSFAAIGVVLLAAPRAVGWLEYDRSAVAEGAWWRLLTGQLVHWTPRMAVLDLLTLFVAGAWLEQRSRRQLGLLMAASALLVGLAVHFWIPELATYRGSSGIASAFFCAAALSLVVESRSSRIRLLAVSVLAALAAKLGWELSTGSALFAGALPEGVRVAPGVHLVGALTGLTLATISRSSKK